MITSLPLAHLPTIGFILHHGTLFTIMGRGASTENASLLVNNAMPTPTKFPLNMVSVSVRPYLELMRLEKVRCISLSVFPNADLGA